MSSIDLRLALPDEVEVVGDRPIKIRCVNPDHRAKDKANSLAVYPDHLHCFGCNFHLGNGQCADGPDCPSCHAATVQALSLLLGHPVSEEEAQHYTTESLDAYRERAATEAKREPLPMALAGAYQAQLWFKRLDRVDWLRERGLSDGTIQDALLGHDGFRFVIPVLDKDDNLLTFRYRRDEEYGDRRPKYCGLPGRNGLYLYPEWMLARPECRDFDWVVVCEGELDALRLWQEMIPAVSPTNGAGQVVKVPALLREQFPWIRRLVFATDQDEPGEEAARLGMGQAELLGFSACRLPWEVGKDVTEAFQCGSLTRGDVIGRSADATGRAA